MKKKNGEIDGYILRNKDNARSVDKKEWAENWAVHFCKPSP
jgi:hypothetical protein